MIFWSMVGDPPRVLPSGKAGAVQSALRRWLEKRREQDLEAPPPERREEVAAELKRLRRENEILRQEREILKRAATFFAREGCR